MFPILVNIYNQDYIINGTNIKIKNQKSKIRGLGLRSKSKI